jgi:hypothetical protein
MTEQKNPHNYRTVGFSMILVSASLVMIALLYLSIGDDVLFSDRVGKQKQFEYQQLLEEGKQKLEQELTQGKDLSVNLDENVNLSSP